jgi:hypothetical protein
MSTIRLPTEFREFLKSLNRSKVEYLLIGGFAVSHHGYPRATGDIDVWISRNAENAGRVVEALEAFGFNPQSVTSDMFLAEKKIVRFGVPPLRIEIHTSISGVEFERCFPNRVAATIDGVDIPLIALADLRTNKKASGRFKDLADLEQLPES